MEISEEELAKKLNDAVREGYYFGIDRFHFQLEVLLPELAPGSGRAFRTKLSGVYIALLHNIPEASVLFEMVLCSKCHEAISTKDLRSRNIICRACKPEKADKYGPTI